jgi:hypothetical protein
MAESGAEAAAAGIGVVGVPTRDRPDCLRRCLLSLVPPQRRNGPAPQYVVVDGSGTPETRRANRQVLEDLRAGSGAIVAYAGPANVAQYADDLACHAGLPRDVVRFGLLGTDDYPVTTGGSRNVLLLHSVGAALLQVDDDTVGPLLPTPGSRDGLVRSPNFDPTEFWPLPDRGPSATAEQAGLAAVHERLLGRELGPGGGRVAATATGVWGDPGMGSSVYLLTLDGPSRPRLLSDEACYRRAVLGRRLLRGVTCPTVGGGLCVALNLGLDHRCLLPPFPPVQRNQDGVFGALLTGYFPGRLIGYLPWMLRHDPPGARPDRTGDGWSRTVRLHSGHIVQALVRRLAPVTAPAQGAAALGLLGQQLRQLGASPRTRFATGVEELVVAQAGRLAAVLRDRLRAHREQPDYWAADVRSVLELLTPEAIRASATEPIDLVEAFGPAEALPRLQHLLRDLGQLMQAWPDMVAAAQSLRAQGCAPAGPV